ncbi:hypothetical protein C8R41DRAFT_447656 [Lentinula lateritia]|uniref:Secreted protein n=1 Tax=Lentinula lateritia TaxID=40482 RepID=A0ABQ8VAT0_9AGAR|nr:hypothetical protein C8R41DRAFT_447656 [Lentinula lateritia]
MIVSHYLILLPSLLLLLLLLLFTTAFEPRGFKASHKLQRLSSGAHRHPPNQALSAANEEIGGASRARWGGFSSVFNAFLNVPRNEMQ